MRSLRFIHLGLQFFSLYQVSPGLMKRYSEYLYDLTLSRCALATKSFLRNSEVKGGGGGEHTALFLPQFPSSPPQHSILTSHKPRSRETGCCCLPIEMPQGACEIQEVADRGDYGDTLD